jgi:hypothetical protein
MGRATNINGVTVTGSRNRSNWNITRINTASKSSDNFIGQTLQPPNKNDEQSVDFDGSNDSMRIDLQSDIFPRNKGTWMQWWQMRESSNVSIRLCFICNKNRIVNDKVFDNYFSLTTQNVSTSPSAMSMYAEYRSSKTGSIRVQECEMKQDSSFHGKGRSRDRNNFSAGGSGAVNEHSTLHFGTIRNDGNFHQVVVTWDDEEQIDSTYSTSYSADGVSYTFPFGYTGSMKIYLDGTLRNFGQSSGEGGPTDGLSHNRQGKPLNFVPMDPTDSNYAAMDAIYISGRPNNDGLGFDNIEANHVDALHTEHCLWNKVLSADEVSTIYNSGVASLDLNYNTGSYQSADSIVHLMDFEDQASTGTDMSINNNSGSFLNGASNVANGTT